VKCVNDGFMVMERLGGFSTNIMIFFPHIYTFIVSFVILPGGLLGYICIYTHLTRECIYVKEIESIIFGQSLLPLMIWPWYWPKKIRCFSPLDKSLQNFQ
jgi:hypothetical protein